MKYEPEADGIERYKRWYRTDIEKAKKWRKEALEDFRFRDGDQYTDDEKKFLEAESRPHVVFNRTGVLVDAVVGSEIGNRREVRYVPREMSDTKGNELLTSSAEWFRDQCDAEDEESEAFKDTVTAGMGWTDTRLDIETNPQGDAKVERINPFEMVWDASASKANLVDTERRWRVRKYSMKKAMGMFPDVAPELLNAAWADEEGDDETPTHVDPGNRYNGDNSNADQRPDGKVTIVACQYIEKETYYKAVILTPPAAEPQVVELDEAKFKIAQKAGVVIQSAKATRKTVMQCILGAGIISQPKPTQTRTFTWNCITGLKDEDKGIFYGIVRRAKDPQRWANKWLSQMMHILNSQAKGGIMAEAGAFEDIREAEKTWARPDGITILADKALTGPTGPKLQPKPVAAFPAGFDRLMHYADEAIVKATGINMELLGLREVNQPGVLEAQRKQAGVGILATFFDSLRRYRKIQGRAMLTLIQEYLSDGRLVRILGNDKQQFVPLTRESVTNIEYDIIVDDAPTSVNEKERTFGLLTQMLPMFRDAIGPQQALIIAKYSPLPTSLIEELQQSMQQGQQQGPDPAQQAAAQLEQMKLANENRNIELQMMQEQNKAKELEFKMAELQQKGVISVMDNQTEKERIDADKLKSLASITQATRPQMIPN